MNKKDLKILQEIRAKAHAIYGDRLWKTQPKADVMLEVLEKALNEERDKFSEQDLEKLQAIKDSAILEGEEKVIDQEVVAELDKYIGDEITRAINEGRMAHPDKDPYIRKIRQQYRKYERRNKQSEGGSDQGTERSSS